MSIMDTKKKFNLIDAIVIVIVAIVIAASAVVLMPKQEKTEKKKTVEKVNQTVVLEVKEKTLMFCENIKVGDTVKESTSKAKLGKITAIEKKPAVAYTVATKDASFVKTEIPDRYDLYITIEIKNSETKRRIGHGLSILGRTYVCSGGIVNVINETEDAK